MKDYYKILGIEEEASEEKIRAHWIELTKRYHPDLSKGSDADENIKEINEAYQVLKNKSTRLEYDLERTFKKMGLKEAHRWKERRINIRNIILPAGILVFSLIVGLVIFRWYRVAIPPKSEVLYEIDRVLEKKTASQIPPVKTESKVQVDEEVLKGIKKEVIPQEKTKIASALPTSSLPPGEKESKPKEEFAPQVVTKSEAPMKVVKEAPKEIPKEIPKETPKEVTQITLQPGEKLESKTEEEKKVPKEIGKVVSQESAKIDKPKPTVMESPPPPKPETLAKVEKRVANEEEVRQFLANYIDRYVRKDINGFLSLFSSKAIQNGKDRLEKIREIYVRFFDQSEELTYRLDDIKVSISGSEAEAMVRYQVIQRLKNRGGEKLWRGNLRWVLVKEDGVLRIITLDYQNDKSS
ncbi:MAG: DnaJ domain-containing protein [Deltaproteobacteria bacterium]|nr:DnaJ domain-containing protein [Deltaproteobacteria bacterium]